MNEVAAYLEDARLHATVLSAFYLAIAWEDERPAKDSDQREAAEKRLLKAYLISFYEYQRSLREENAALRNEVLRLKRLVVEPMVSGPVK